MLSLKEPIQLNSQRGMTSISDSFGAKIIGNYGLLGARFAPKDLLFALTTPVEFPEDMGGITTIAVEQSTTNMRQVTLDVVTNVVNRIHLANTPTFTYQDQVYITSVLNKLGITDVQEFMTQVKNLREDNMSTTTLINLYQQELKRLGKGADAIADPSLKRGESPVSREGDASQPRPRHFLHDAIYQRLQTAQVYHTVNSFQRSYAESTQFFRNQELRTTEQLRISQSLMLQELKQQVHYGDAISLRHHINHYELGDILPPPVTQEQVYEQASVAALLTAVDNVTLQAIDRSLHRSDLWLNVTHAVSQSAENTLTRFERYHSEDSAQFIEHQSYTHTLRELRREEIGWLKALYQRETNLYIEGAAATLLPPHPLLPPAMTHTDLTVEGDVVEGDTTQNESVQITHAPVDLTQIQMALSGHRPPIAPVTPIPTPVTQVETIHRHTEQGGEIITSEGAEITLHHLMSLERELTHLVQEPATLLSPQVIAPLIQRHATSLTTTITTTGTPPVPQMPTTMDAILAQIVPPVTDDGSPRPTQGQMDTAPLPLVHQQEAPTTVEELAPTPPATSTTIVVEGTQSSAQASPSAETTASIDVPTIPTPPVSPRPSVGESADPLTLIHQQVEGTQENAPQPSSAIALATAVVGQTRQQIERQTQINNYLTALTNAQQVEIPTPTSPEGQRTAQEFLAADLALPPTEVDSVTLLRQMDEINQRNITLHQIVEAQRTATAQTPKAPGLDKTRTMDDAFRSLTDPQQVIKDLMTAEVTPPKAPPLPPAAMVALQQADPETRTFYEQILRYHQDPSGALAEGIVQPATIGALNADAARIAHQQAVLTHQTEVLTEETERHSVHTQVLLEHLREPSAQQSAPPPQSRPRPAVHMIHKQEENILSEELLERLQTQQVKSETKQVIEQQVSHETVRQTDVHTLSKQVVTQATEDITALVNRTMTRQLGTITDKVYQQMEKKLQTERNRRGRF